MSDVKYVPDSAQFIKGPLLWWQKRGLMYTRTGYGKKIPTEYLVKWDGRTYRVYCAIFSNSGVLYITRQKEDYCIRDYEAFK